MTRFHIVGIGGVGMSAIARILLAPGHAVTGSDNGSWPLAEALARDGAAVHETFAAEHVRGAEIVIRSSAYKEDNVEVRAALDAGIPVWKRDDAWRFVTEGKRVVAIAGTHGKSTTTAMTWSALKAGGIDASLICGAVIRGLGTNAHAGNSDVFVIEADEYDNAFLALQPEVAVVTTLDHDHIDIFPTRESYRDAFREFVRRGPIDALLIACADDQGSKDLAGWAATARRNVIMYGTEDEPTCTIRDVDLGDNGASYALWLHDDMAAGQPVSVRLAVRGRHNVLNSAAAILAARAVGVPPVDAARGVEFFRGIGRRLEELGRARDILVVDDYAHHPAELAASMAAIRPKGHELVVVFQPHTPSRLEAFFEGFEDAFHLPEGWTTGIIVETFSSAREGRDPKGLSQALAAGICGFYAVDGEVAAREAVRIAKPGDVILVMGAGDVRPIGERVLELLRTPV